LKETGVASSRGQVRAVVSADQGIQRTNRDVCAPVAHISGESSSIVPCKDQHSLNTSLHQWRWLFYLWIHYSCTYI